MNDTTAYTKVSKLQSGDRVYLGSDRPVQLTEVEHVGGSLTRLYGPAGLVASKDSRECVFVQR